MLVYFQEAEVFVKGLFAELGKKMNFRIKSPKNYAKTRFFNVTVSFFVGYPIFKAQSPLGPSLPTPLHTMVSL